MTTQLAEGWRKVDRLETCQVLVQQRRGQLGSHWMRLDPENPEQTRDVSLCSGMGPLGYESELESAFYSQGGKIFRFDLGSYAEELVADLSEEENVRSQVWVDPPGSTRLIFIVNRWEPTLREARELVGKAGRRGVSMQSKDFRLMALDLQTKKASELAHFQKEIYPGGASVDSQKRCLFALTNGGLMMSLDLASGALSYREAQYGGLTMSEGQLLAWHDDGIFRVRPDGTDERLSDRGSAPAVSKKGTIAFGMSHQLWVCAPDGVSEVIISCESVAWQHSSIPPGWCACGEHVAIGMLNHRGQAFTAVADVKKKQALTYAHADSRNHGGIIWRDR